VGREKKKGREGERPPEKRRERERESASLFLLLIERRG